jgi:hypothetical protein
MLAICVHTWNPKATGMTEEEFLPAREKFMKDLMAKNPQLPNMSTTISLNLL